MKYLNQYWPHLLMTFLGSVVSTSFAMGIAWATLGNRIANLEHRLDEVDKSQVAQTRWQVQQNVAAIAALQSDARQTAASIAQIDTRLGVIDAKLDTIAEAVKHRPAQEK